MSAAATLPSWRIALADVVRTARLPKIVPVPLLVWSGWALSAERGTDALVMGTLGVLAVTLLVTRLNVLTDEALDRTSRPELARSLRRSGRAIALASVLELGVVVLALAALGAGRRWALVGLAFFGVLYSYNFLSARPVRARWKAHWLGHGVAFLGSYVALWSVGAGRLALAVGLATGLADYAVYVGECAIDHEEEARAGLDTLAARLGPRASSLVALALFGVAALLHAWFLRPELVLAFVPALALRGAWIALLAAAEHARRPAIAHTLRLRGADVVFLGTRVWTCVALVLACR